MPIIGYTTSSVEILNSYISRGDLDKHTYFNDIYMVGDHLNGYSSNWYIYPIYSNGSNNAGFVNTKDIYVSVKITNSYVPFSSDYATFTNSENVTYNTVYKLANTTDTFNMYNINAFGSNV